MMLSVFGTHVGADDEYFDLDLGIPPIVWFFGCFFLAAAAVFVAMLVMHARRRGDESTSSNGQPRAPVKDDAPTRRTS